MISVKDCLKYFFSKPQQSTVKITLDQVTLVGVDCVDADRLKMVMELCQSQVQFGDVQLLSNLEVDAPYWKKIEPIKSTEAYSEFIIRKLPTYIKTPFALVVQYDGFILNPSQWTNDFLKYDYVGAPWWFLTGNNIGNGGFSLRSKKLMDVMAEDSYNVPVLHPEDYVFLHQRFHHLVNQGIKFAPYEIAKRFAIEGRDNTHDVWRNSFGFHGINVTDLKKWDNWSCQKRSLRDYFFKYKINAAKIYRKARKRYGFSRFSD
jgi:hypothetical protein